MEWIELTNDEELDPIISLSNQRTQVIFKHSTRCSISSVAWKRVQKNEKQEESIIAKVIKSVSTNNLFFIM